MALIKSVPWLPDFLQTAVKEMKTPLPTRTNNQPLPEDIQWIEEQIHDTHFDKLGLKQEMFKRFQQGGAQIYKQTCSLGTFLVVSSEPIPQEVWDEWWHCVRFLHASPVRIVVFSNPTKRAFPPRGHPIGPEHINGGSTIPCDARTIVIYRKQEASRVILHELLHASCSDPYHKQTPFIEADTEAWAELCLIALRTKGDPRAFSDHWKRHLVYSVDLCVRLSQEHGVNTPADYGWRYTKGRLDVWKHLGFQIPEPSGKPQRQHTLLLLDAAGNQ